MMMFAKESGIKGRLCHRGPCLPAIKKSYFFITAFDTVSRKGRIKVTNSRQYGLAMSDFSFTSKSPAHFSSCSFCPWPQGKWQMKIDPSSQSSHLQA